MGMSTVHTNIIQRYKNLLIRKKKNYHRQTELQCCLKAEVAQITSSLIAWIAANISYSRLSISTRSKAWQNAQMNIKSGCSIHSASDMCKDTSLIKHEETWHIAGTLKMTVALQVSLKHAEKGEYSLYNLH